MSSLVMFRDVCVYVHLCVGLLMCFNVLGLFMKIYVQYSTRTHPHHD